MRTFAAPLREPCQLASAMRNSCVAHNNTDPDKELGSSKLLVKVEALLWQSWDPLRPLLKSVEGPTKSRMPSCSPPGRSWAAREAARKAQRKRHEGPRKSPRSRATAVAHHWCRLGGPLGALWGAVPNRRAHRPSSSSSSPISSPSSSPAS